MENDAKVFVSNITRAENNQNNNLYDLLNIVPAKPKRPTVLKTHNCDFKPQTDKYYVSKRKTKLKVKTVGDIRKIFEQDTYSYLSTDLESQEKLLFKRIKRGSSRNDDTKSLASSILKLDRPVFRSTWEMLVNLNPEQHAYPRQFVIWNGKHIQVNGSCGGSKKIICNYDLAYKNQTSQNFNKNICTHSTFDQKKGLIRNSLAVKFKPGPLRKKFCLDQSHQKYHIGNAELINLPKPYLDIQPTYGTALESTLNNYLNNFRQEDGTITQKWAELAVSVLGRVEKSNFVQLNKDCVTFELNYKYDRHQILMRRDKENVLNNLTVKESDTIAKSTKISECNVLPEVEDMMSKILDCVEISLIQDNIYNKDENESNILKDLNSSYTDNNVKTKRRYCELDRLDVTVITMPEIKKLDVNQCGKAHCRLGCICVSLDGTQNLSQHCGRVRCMFECKCGYSNKSGLLSARDNDLECISNLDKKINVKLAKEEKKFHQTVIVTGEKRILLKAERRNCKIPEKYAEFYNNIRIKQENQKNLAVSIVIPKFNFENVVPWCMVHKLYKCFCKGRFTDTGESLNNGTDIAPSLEHSVNVVKDQCTNSSINTSESLRIDQDDKIKRKDRPITPVKITESLEVTSAVDNAKYKTRFSVRNLEKAPNYNDELTEEIYTCARIMPYEGRKFSDGYYRHTNNKILEMEKNDKRLQDRLAVLNQDQHEVKSKNKSRINTTIDSSILDMLYKEDETNPLTIEKNETITSQTKRKRLSSKTKLVAWLEANYKLYKERSDQGLIKKSLEPPKLGKIVLHSWEFILNRYREQKNLFLISQQKPFRIFMAVHTRHPFFDNCLNINDIRFADLHKYPQTVKNLLINATDLKDFFCILRGLAFCWELIGSVAKINEDVDGQEINVESSGKETFVIYDSDDSSEDNTSLETCNKKAEERSLEISDETIASKWFVMTIENDFSEIRFPEKGFFVTHKSIMKVICMARLANKTVRLSSRQCVEESENPSFGIYAMPNTNENCVLVGPYELKDPLGIETVKTFLDFKSYHTKMTSTRGFWMKTSKVDNLQVVENPLSFMSLANPHSKHSIPLENHCLEEGGFHQNHIFPGNHDKIEKPKPSNSPQKVVKPIKIRKTNGFYHLASDGVLKRIALPPNLAKAMPVVLNTCLNTGNGSVLQPAANNMKIVQFSPINSNIKTTSLESNVRSITLQSNVNATPFHVNSITSEANHETTQFESNTETESYVINTPEKEVDTFSLQNENSPKKQERMFVLKPEEINRKLLQESTSSMSTAIAVTEYCSEDEPSNVNMTELLLENTSESEYLGASNDDVYVISDDDESITEFKTENDLRDVWIECTNVIDLGWITGRKNCYNLLSFKFPGYDYSEFYPEDRVFFYINAKLCEMSNSSMSKEIKWKVVESPEQLRGSEIDPEKILSINPSFSREQESTAQIDLPDVKETFVTRKVQH
ncbi:uncharacterized protein LOC113508376 isoform X2 [Trichoplusia ni]|uniref:Uncharacterized protein LOC113508376 isoform X2 n=1 Tax=Trichoplusia ni TaxID=7111 RepID=A0A7E5X3E1_TRINI|nr:uncharacterized protein LOC113508376 isoform X2 [Trichoplusia ni]